MSEKSLRDIWNNAVENVEREDVNHFSMTVK